MACTEEAQHTKETMKIELRNTADIKPYAKNPRLNDDAVDAVATSITEYGFRQTRTMRVC